MGIDFSKFAKDIQTKIKSALSDNKIDAEEVRAMNLEKDVAIKLMQELSGNPDIVGDGFIKGGSKNKKLILLDKPENGSTIPLTQDSLSYYKNINPNVEQGIYQDGKIYLADKQGMLLKDKNNNYISEQVFFEKTPAELSFINSDNSINVEKFQAHLNELPDSSEDYQTLMKDIENSSKEQSYWSIEKFANDQKERFIKVYNAIDNHDLGLAVELMYSFFQEECQGFDENVLLKIKSGLERLTGAKWAGPALYNVLSFVSEHVDDLTGKDENGIGTTQRLLVGFDNSGQGLGDFIFSSEGLFTMGAIAGGEALLANASSTLAPYVGAVIHSYFGAEGTIMVADGAKKVATGETLEEVAEGGQEIGHGLPMIPTVIRAGVLGYNGTKSMLNGLKINEFRLKIQEATTSDEITKLQASIDEMPYSNQEKAVLKMECLKQSNKIMQEGVNKGVKEEPHPQTTSPEGRGSERTLEGGVKDTELTEVAPFAQRRLDRDITPDDLIPERKMVDLENGEFTAEGEFKSDGTHSVTDAPIADASYDVVYREKFATYKKMPDGNEQIIATTQKSLSKQILNIIGGKKVHEGLQNAIDGLIKDGKASIKDISEVIVNLEYLTNNSSFAKEFLRPSNLEKIQDFQSFKSNLDSYARFKHQMDRAPENWAQDFTWNVGSQKVKNLLERSIEFENLIKLGDIKPEEFNKNVDTFYKLGYMLKETVCYDRTSFSDFMFQVHSDKFFERLDYINEFNKKQHWQRQNAYYVNIRTEGGLENDANFEIIKKNIETYPRARQYDSGAANMLRNGNTVEADWFIEFENKIPDKAKRKYAYEQYHWLVREGHSPEIIDKYAEFMNTLPNEILVSFDYMKEHICDDYSKIFGNFRNHNYGRGNEKSYVDELVKRARILAKCPDLLLDRSSHRISPYSIKDFLCDTEFKDTDKVVEFVENAEPFALAKYRMNTESRNDKNFAQIMNEANLDLWIENAKLHQELNPKFKEYLNSNDALGFKGGFNEKFDYAYDIPTEELKARIDAINEYADKLDMRVLDYIYVGRIPCNTKILDVLTQLEPEVINNFESYSSFRYVQNLASYSEQGLKNFITFANKYKNRRDLIENLQNVSFSNIINSLTEAELSKLNSYIIIDCNSTFKPDIDMIRKRIASIPEKVRKYFVDEKNILTDKYNDKIFDENGYLTTDNPFKYLDTLSETELKAIGPKAISEFIDNYHKSYEKPEKSFDKARLKVLTELPEPLLEKLEGGSKYNMLTGRYPLNTHVITYRYNELVKYGKFEKLDGQVAERICSMPDYSYHLVSEILKAHNDKLTDYDFKDICNNMPISESFEQSEIEYIRKQLINNPKNNPRDIDAELRFLYGKYTTLASKENLPFQKEVLEDMIERGSKADVKIGQILTWIGNRDIDTAKIVYDCALTCWNDPAVKPANIGELISGIGKNNSSFAQKAFHHPKFMGKKDALPQILRELDEYNQSLAEFMFLESDKFSVEDGTQILQHTKKENKEFVERICREGGLTNHAIIKLAKYTIQKGNADKADKLLTSDEMKHWTEENLNNGLDIETITHLGRTQKKLYTEAKQAKDTQDIQAKKEEARRIQMEHAQAEVRADVNALETITKELVALDVPEGMAKNAYAKLCVDSNGNIDRMKLDAVRALIKTYGVSKTTNDKGKLKINVNISPKDITDIFKLATGDKMSADNGKFRPQVIKDIIALKECGIDDIRFAMNLASIKNMSLVEMKARFKGETRQDVAKRIDEGANKGISKETLKQRGIDLDEIREKVLTSDKKIEELGNVKIKEGQGSAQIRSLESIIGTERQVLNKFKDQVQPEVWGNPDAFKRWAEEKLADITDWEKHPEYVSKDYAAYNKPRQEGLEKWVEFLKSDESGVKDDVFAQILFLDGITKEMKPDNAYTPPAISREVFEHVYNEILAGNTDVSFTQAYSELNKKKAIEKYGTPTVSEDGIQGTWVKIPQSKKGEPLYDEHIAMVQSLAQGSAWCLRFENAHGYLQSGDIHFFVDSKGDSQIAINVYPNGQIHDMQRRYKQDGTVPIPYIVPIAKYYKEHNFKGREKAIQDALDAKPEFDRQKVEFAKMLEEGRTADIFNELGDNSYAHELEVSRAEDGSYILNNYTPFIKGKPYSLYDLGINEDVLFENVSEVSRSMYLDGSALKTAPKLKKVGIRISFGDNKANDFRTLEEINGKKVSWDE